MWGGGGGGGVRKGEGQSVFRHTLAGENYVGEVGSW